MPTLVFLLEVVLLVLLAVVLEWVDRQVEILGFHLVEVALVPHQPAAVRDLASAQPEEPLPLDLVLVAVRAPVSVALRVQVLVLDLVVPVPVLVLDLVEVLQLVLDQVAPRDSVLDLLPRVLVQVLGLHLALVLALALPLHRVRASPLAVVVVVVDSLLHHLLDLVLVLDLALVEVARALQVADFHSEAEGEVQVVGLEEETLHFHLVAQVRQEEVLVSDLAPHPRQRLDLALVHLRVQLVDLEEAHLPALVLEGLALEVEEVLVVLLASVLGEEGEDLDLREEEQQADPLDSALEEVVEEALVPDSDLQHFRHQALEQQTRLSSSLHSRTMHMERFLK